MLRSSNIGIIHRHGALQQWLCQICEERHPKLPGSAAGQTCLDEITGGNGNRQPNAYELDLAKLQGGHVATIASKLPG